MTNIEKAKRVLLRLNFKLTDTPIFHGCCFNCNMPKIEGLHSCYDCSCFDIKNKENKSEKYEFVSCFWLLEQSDTIYERANMIDSYKKIKHNIEINKIIMKTKAIINLEKYSSILEGTTKSEPEMFEIIEKLLDKEAERLKNNINSNSLHIKATETLKKPFEEREPYYKQLFKYLFTCRW